MSRRVWTALIALAMSLIALALALWLVAWVHGSLEMFPGDEQQGKVHIAGFLGAFLLVGAEVLLWVLLRRVRRRALQRTPPLPRRPQAPER